MHRYTVIGSIGKGAHGHVVKAKDRVSGQIVALKHATCVTNEVDLLLKVRHPNIIKLIAHFTSNNGLLLTTLCLEYCKTDLGLLLASAYPLTPALSKRILRDILTGLDYLHSLSILHRDIKPHNILLFPRIQIADFGLSRPLSPTANYSHHVMTRWYRAPEILYGARSYSNKIDIYAAGCIFAELFNRTPLFPGINDIDQLAKVMDALGSPTLDQWPALALLPDYNKILFSHRNPKLWPDLVPEAPPHALLLLQSMLKYNDLSRISAQDALEHDYFYEWPHAADMSDFPAYDLYV